MAHEPLYPPMVKEGKARIMLILISAALVAATVVAHVAGLSLVLRSVTKWGAVSPTRVRHTAWLLIRVAWLLVLIHLAEIAVWALFYQWRGWLPDVESALYFSGATYTTVGYGDLVLPNRWRLLGPVEGLTGILMCGLSASVFFAIVSKSILIDRSN
jgi:hypothetical protein